MKVDDVITQLVVLRLNGLVVFRQQLVVADLLLKFLDVALLTLAEGALASQAVSCYFKRHSMTSEHPNKARKENNLRHIMGLPALVDFEQHVSR